MKDFCLVPWYSLEPGLRQANDRSCCLWNPRTYDTERIRREFIAGDRPRDCDKCWFNEDRGLVSKRNLDNRFILEQTGLGISEAVEKVKTQCVSAKFYQLQLSNTCNQACATCGPSASTRWISLDSGTKNKPATKSLDTLNIDYKSAMKMSFTGGEPLYDSRTYKCLQRLLDAGNTDCNIVFVTNGSIPLKEKYQSVLKYFKNVSVVVSIDGIGPVFEYMRWPGKWDLLLENLTDYRNRFDNVSVSYTLSSLNVWYHEQTVDWFDKQNLNYNINIVSNPAWADPKLLPNYLKKNITPGTFADRFSAVTGAEVPLEVFIAEIKRQDSLKNISLKDYLPELSVLIDS